MEQIEDDFVLLEMEPPKPKTQLLPQAAAGTKISVNLQTISRSSNEFLLSIIPPKQPVGELRHTPCDIVLVIDISGSMRAAAELPDQACNDKKETSGLSILDLVKHATRTIIEKLEEGDRLAVITFSSSANVVQELLPMTEPERTATWERIEGLRPQDSTNLWAGIREGLKVIEDTGRIGNTQSIIVLTDGVPTLMCPTQGYVKKLQPMLQKMRLDRGDTPSISCFGFGYHLRSALLRSIAEVGRGYYAFIPDAGMIGTVFVHAVANLFCTHATNAEVDLTCSNGNAEIQLPSWLDFDTEQQGSNRRVLHIGNVQYGQSRDVVVKLQNASPKDTLTATIRCHIRNQVKQIASTTCRACAQMNIQLTKAAYHIWRHEVCACLASLSTKNQKNEHESLSADALHTKSNVIGALVKRMQGQLTSISVTDPTADLTDLRALLADLQSPDPSNPHGSGQIALAIQVMQPAPSASMAHGRRHSYEHCYPERSYYQRWGMHYLPSILHAHMRQICTTFKDPGPLRYGIDSPLFIKMRDELDDAFDKLPAPKGSLTRHGERRTPVSMHWYNNSSNPCFAGECQVRLGESNTYCSVESLRPGHVVWTVRGSRIVRGVVMTPIDRTGSCSQDLVHISDGAEENRGDDMGLWITPYHPIYHNTSRQWVFPKDVSTRTKVVESGAVYSILLEADENSNAHAMEVGGVLCATLGHGVTGKSPQPQHEPRNAVQSESATYAGAAAGSRGGDVRSHPFFGSYTKVLASLERLSRDEHGRWVSGGVIKNQELESNGIACDFVGL